jgi:enamine deaminase RidA (YjgF/YER057c/UK114 family)
MNDSMHSCARPFTPLVLVRHPCAHTLNHLVYQAGHYRPSTVTETWEVHVSARRRVAVGRPSTWWALALGASVTTGACAPMGRGMGGGGMEGGGEGGRLGGIRPEGVEPRYINPGTLAALPGFTHAVKVGLVTYVSGEVALDSTGQLVGAGDVRAQARQAFANLKEVLDLARARPADITKLTLYVVNLAPGDLEAIRQAAPAFFPERNPPAGTVVGVAALPRAGLLIAVDAVAVTRGELMPRE